ncbi:hypothetical protein DB30_03242 [Enhygromyxa salina]|uniref:Uncharacterized protein n=1 Tax=Enhygromyxa salina TaxID=215803 RepID=A0A0C2D2P4_9BACT|nr:hypothetical protein DB30_03242 [Enhygromyxa salina]
MLEFGGRQLVVEDPGQTPRRQLSYAGTHERRVRISVSQREPTAEGGKVLPTYFVVELDWRGEAPAEGPAIHEFAVKSVQGTGEGNGPKKPSPPQMKEVFEARDAAFLRVRGSVRVEDGHPLQILANRDGVRLTPDIPAVLDVFLLPLPGLPVGVGARWVTTDSKTKERREYVLTKLDETSVTIVFERTSPEDSSLRPPNIRGRFELRSMASTEPPKLLLSDPLPTRGRLEFELELQHFGKAGDRTVGMYQILELDTQPDRLGVTGD